MFEEVRAEVEGGHQKVLDREGGGGGGGSECAGVWGPVQRVW